LDTNEIREKLDTAQFNRAQDTEKVICELRAQEVYGTYMKDANPVDILNDGHTKVAAKLMVEEGLDEEATYFEDSRDYSGILRSNWALSATMIVLKDISSAPTAGESRIPQFANTPAANGMATMLYPAAHHRFWIILR
jgi:hypothetical protein